MTVINPQPTLQTGFQTLSCPSATVCVATGDGERDIFGRRVDVVDAPDHRTFLRLWWIGLPEHDHVHGRRVDIR